MWPISLDRISAWFRPAQPVREQLDRLSARLSNVTDPLGLPRAVQNTFQNLPSPARSLALITVGAVAGAPATAAGVLAYFAYPHLRPTFENARDPISAFSNQPLVRRQRELIAKNLFCGLAIQSLYGRVRHGDYCGIPF